jgi:dipeptidyl-peptidase 4
MSESSRREFIGAATTWGLGLSTAAVTAASSLSSDGVSNSAAAGEMQSGDAVQLNHPGAVEQLDSALYQRAETLLNINRSKLVAGGQVKPRWIDQGARFWYSAARPEGQEFILAEPARHSRKPAFDHGRLAAALQSASGTPVNAAALPFAAIEIKNDAVEFFALGSYWRCSLTSYRCEQVRDHVFANPLEVKSPDGKWVVFRRGYDLWIRSVASGQERALTSDGAEDYAYGAQPDTFSYKVLIRKFGLPYLPPLVSWSPDSKRMLTHRTDQRGVRLTHLVEAAPADGGVPVLHTSRYPLPGDEVIPRAEMVVFDIEAQTTVAAKGPAMLLLAMSPLMDKRLWWSADGSAVFYYEQSRDYKTLRLRHLDPRTGEVRTVIEESAEPRMDSTQFFYQEPIGRVLSNHREALWYSQRDGWGHLYLYDLKSGRLLGQVTSGRWAVQSVLHVDEQKRVVYFIAAGLVEKDVYRRQVCRVGLDGKGFTRLSNDDLDHIVTMPESAAYYIDSASAVETPPVISVRGWDGRQLVELERADVSRLLATGWTMPERFCVKAADGVTDIYGVLYRPHGFDPKKRYPIIDDCYPGPQVTRCNPCFGEQVPVLRDTESLAALGFAVITVDGRGTPGRDKAFHDLSYGHLDKAGHLEDHIAALRQLAQTRPWLDLDRVGMFGHSGGGFATARALLAYPDFFKVGVSLSGSHDVRETQSSWGEIYLGSPKDNADSYLRASNVEIADRLQGKLLLIHGEMDDTDHPQQTLRLANRLIAANKDFDLLIVPGAEHLLVGYHSYITRRTWDFFVRHLLNAQPPEGYQLTPVPLPSPEAMFG